MKNEIQYVAINNEEVPLKIVNIKNAKHVKFFVRDNVIKITKPRYCSKMQLNKIISQNKEEIYNMYKSAISYSLDRILYSDIEILYLGEKYILSLKEGQKNKVIIHPEEKNIVIEISSEVSDGGKIFVAKEILKKFFKNNLKLILEERLKYWSNAMGLNYSGFSIKSMKSKYGSCNIKTFKLSFNLNMIFMPQYIMDSIIVHELSHIKYPNHSTDFYKNVEKYIQNYKECKKWLIKNQKYLNII